MLQKKKTIILTLSIVSLMLISIFATFAFLTSEDSVKNTFTVGNVQIELYETKTDVNGNAIPSTTTTENETTTEGNEYHLLPGHTYLKDPTVKVIKDSEEAYVRLLVEVQDIDALKEAIPFVDYYIDLNGDNTNDFILQLLTKDKNDQETWNFDKWAFDNYKEEERTIDNEPVEFGIYEFRYFKTIQKADTDTILEPLFTYITVPDEVNNTQLAKLNDVKISIKAQAIQKDGFDTAEDAWSALQ